MSVVWAAGASSNSLLVGPVSCRQLGTRVSKHWTPLQPHFGDALDGKHGAGTDYVWDTCSCTEYVMLVLTLTCTSTEYQTLALSAWYLHMHQWFCDSMQHAQSTTSTDLWPDQQATSVWDVKFWIGTRQWGVINCDLLVMIILQKYPPTASSTLPPGIASRSQSQTQVNQNYLHSSWLIICRDPNLMI